MKSEKLVLLILSIPISYLAGCFGYAISEAIYLNVKANPEYIIKSSFYWYRDFYYWVKSLDNNPTFYTYQVVYIIAVICALVALIICVYYVSMPEESKFKIK